MAKYFVSSSIGDDINAGTSESAPWKTVAKVNAMASTFKVGDFLLFKRGDVWYEQMNTGNTRPLGQGKLVVSAYGVGPRPLFNYYKTINNNAWVLHAANIWKANVNDITKITGNVNTLGADGANIGFLNIDGDLRDNKKFTVADLNADWQFYSDEVDTLYVYSATNPGVRAVNIKVSPRLTYFSAPAKSTVHTGLAVCGTSGHAVSGAHTNEDFLGNKIFEIGGGRATGTVRYGNGIEIWNGSKDMLVAFNEITEVYDSAITLQGYPVTSTTGWRNIWVRHNLIYNTGEDAFELFAQGASPTASTPDIEPNAGFFNCGFEYNICINSGLGKIGASRPDGYYRGHILMYAMYGTVNDISIQHNVFIGTALYVIASSGSGGRPLLPVGMKFGNNTVLMQPGQQILKKDPNAYTGEQAAAFEAAYPSAAGTVWEIVADGADLSIQDTIKKAVSYLNAEASQANAMFDGMQQLYADMGAIYASVMSTAPTISGPQTGDLNDVGYQTQMLTLPVDNKWWVPIATASTTNGNLPMNFTFLFMHCNDSTLNRKGVGMVSVQVVSHSDKLAADVYLDVVEWLPLRFGLSASAFKAVTTIADGTTVEVQLFYNIGIDNNSRLAYVPVMVQSYNSSNSYIEFFNKAALVDVLPAGIQTTGGNSDMCGTVALVAGQAVVSSTMVQAGSKIFLTTQSLGTVTTPKAIAVTAKTVNGYVNGTFTIKSADATDTSTIAWEIKA